MSTNDELFYVSAVELARRIRARKVTSSEVVEAHLREVERLNPRLNAVVATRFAEARAEAKAADERTAASHPDDLPELHGVPCTIKECFALTGMPQTSGLVARKGFVASEDATAVARLRRAGAIPLGVTNTSELCMWMESDNKVYGRTNNPYDLDRIVGGSSGGEGAIVGSGASPFGLGSDIGGSIRMPAFFNGVFGHKATGGLVPNSGQFPLAVGENASNCVTGPLTRRAEDLPPLMRILAGPDGICEGARPMKLGDERRVSLKRLEVLSVPDDGGRIFVSRSLRDAQTKVEDFLESRGARVRRKRLKHTKHALEIWSAALSTSEGASYAEMLGNGEAVSVGKELGRFVRGESPYTLPSLALALIERFTQNEKQNEEFLALGRALRDELAEEVGDEGIFLYPSHAMPAPKHGFPMLLPVMWAYTAVWNAVRVPTTQIPLGLDARGVPLGIQVGAMHGQDHRTMALALALEDAFGGWVRPRL